MHKDVGYSAIHNNSGVRNYCHEILLLRFNGYIIFSTFVLENFHNKNIKKKRIAGEIVALLSSIYSII